MAQTKSRKKTTPTPVNTPPKIDKKKQLRLAFGMLFLLVGAYVTLVIISYFFTWQADQDLIAGTLTENTNPNAVQNWGGMLGAKLSHNLVYRGAGIISILLGVWVMALGLNLLYGRRVLPIMQYLRWFSIVVLMVAPLLAYVIPNSSFPYGGALGNQAIAMMNNYIGKMGTGFIIGGRCFVFHNHHFRTRYFSTYQKSP